MGEHFKHRPAEYIMVGHLDLKLLFWLSKEYSFWSKVQWLEVLEVPNVTWAYEFDLKFKIHAGQWAIGPMTSGHMIRIGRKIGGNNNK